MARRTENTLTAEAADVLARATVTPDRVTLPAGQLDRRVYVEVDETLRRIGGKWNRGQRAHLFTTDPTGPLAALIAAGKMPADADKAMSFWRTPADLADRLVRIVEANVRDRQNAVLEPSAGDGAIVEAWHRVAPDVPVVALEPDRGRYEALVGVAATQDWTHCVEFERWARVAGAGAEVEGVAMNPPFTLPGKPAAWADHFLLAWDNLAPGATVACVVPISYATDRRDSAILARVVVEAHGRVESVPAGTFRMSGTDVATAILVAVKTP